MPRYVMCLLVTVLLVVPSAASAVTTTAVTTPADGSHLLVDENNPGLIHFAGTADAGTPAVDLYCVSSRAGVIGVQADLIKSNVDSSSGSFSTDAALPTNVSLCEVFAVAHGAAVTTNSDLNGLSGSKIYPATKLTSTYSGKQFDYYVTMDGPGGFYELDSFGSCGLSFGELLQMHEQDGQIFDCNGYAESQDPTSSGAAPSVVVDQHPSYTTHNIGSDGSLRDVPGWTALTYDVADDAGSWHLTSHEGIFKCASSDAFPPSACTSFASTGVGLNLGEKLSPDGRTMTQTLRFAGEDNQQHTISLVLDQTSVDAREWFFPGTAGFASYGGTDPVSPVAPAVATIRNRLGTDSATDITRGYGAITYSTTPTSEQFFHAGDEFAQRYTNMTIPAGGAVRLVFVYTMNAGTSGLDGQVATAESSFGAPPAITVTSSANATSAAYTLTGTVNAPEGLNGLTVNNAPVAVASNGSFSVPETLANGANAFTLTATDELGRSSTTPFSVTLSSSGSPNNPLAVKFGRSGKPKLKGRTLTTGATASCPGTGPDCSIAATASVGRKKAGSGKATVRAGATAKLTVKLTKAGAKLFKRKHKLTLKLTGKRTGAATSSATQTVKLKTKKR